MSIEVLKFSDLSKSNSMDAGFADVKYDNKFMSNYFFVAKRVHDSNLPLAHTKDIAEIAATSKKPFKQKGTGSARQGSKVSAQHRGGAVAHGPRAIGCTVKINAKATKKAKKMALKMHHDNKKLFVLDSIDCSKVKTKTVYNLLQKLGVDLKYNVLLLTEELNDSNLVKSARNIPNLVIKNSKSVTVYNLLKAKAVIAQEGDLKQLIECLS